MIELFMLLHTIFVSQGFSHVTCVFSVKQNWTVALCELSFSTDLEEIRSALVTDCNNYKINIIFVTNISRCLALFSITMKGTL